MSHLPKIALDLKSFIKHLELDMEMARQELLYSNPIDAKACEEYSKKITNLVITIDTCKRLYLQLFKESV